MPKSDNTNTVLAGSRNPSGEQWKEEYSTGEREAKDEFHMEESGEERELADEATGTAAPAFAGLLEGLDSDPGDEDLDLLGDEEAGSDDSEDWDDFSEDGDGDLDGFEDLDEI